MQRYIGSCMIMVALLLGTATVWPAERYTIVFKSGAVAEVTNCRRDGNLIYLTNLVGIELKYDANKEIDVDQTVRGGNPPPCFGKPRVSVPAKEEYRAVHFEEGSSDYHCVGGLTKRENGFFFEGKIMRGTAAIGKHEFAIPVDQISEVRDDSIYKTWKGAGKKTFVREKRKGAVNVSMKNGERYEINYYAEPGAGTIINYPPLIDLFPKELVKRSDQDPKKDKAK